MTCDPADSERVRSHAGSKGSISGHGPRLVRHNRWGLLRSLVLPEVERGSSDAARDGDGGVALVVDTIWFEWSCGGRILEYHGDFFQVALGPEMRCITKYDEYLRSPKVSSCTRAA